MQLIDGKRIAEKIKDDIVKEILTPGDERPNLAIILVGEREDSQIYVRLKEKEAKKVGIDTHLYKCDSDISEADLLATIDFLNNDEMIDGILLQLPLPDGFDTKKIVSRIDSTKDVDGFHPENLERYMAGEAVEIEPLLVSVTKRIFDDMEFSPKGKRAVAVVNSEFFGKTMQYAMASLGAEAIFCYPDDLELSVKTCGADILITALGQPHFIKAEMIKSDAVVIDIGISRLPDGQIAGDVDALSVVDKPGYLTPVPGGVGPLTIAMALFNTLKLYRIKSARIMNHES
jgi:methylenetetrahydrofolate dehydrogenase (NADP+) / methenyltetrahydrofolate cyclohydrolase